MFTLPNEPQTVGQTLDTGFKLYFQSFKHVLLISAIMNGMWIITSFLYGPQQAIDQQIAGDDIAGLIAIIIVLALMYFVLQVAMIERIHRFTQGDLGTLGDALNRGKKLFLPMLGASIMNMLVIGIGMLLLVIPGIVLAIYMFLFPAALVIEGSGPVQSLQRSMDLVKQNWWRCMLILTVVGTVYMILYSVVILALSLSIALSTPEDIAAFALYGDLAGSVIATILTPLLFSMVLVIFNDLKLRREGGDLEARINEMD